MGRDAEGQESSNTDAEAEAEARSKPESASEGGQRATNAARSRQRKSSELPTSSVGALFNAALPPPSRNEENSRHQETRPTRAQPMRREDAQRIGELARSTTGFAAPRSTPAGRALANGQPFPQDMATPSTTSVQRRGDLFQRESRRPHTVLIPDLSAGLDHGTPLASLQVQPTAHTPLRPGRPAAGGLRALGLPLRSSLERFRSVRRAESVGRPSRAACTADAQGNCRCCLR